MGLALVGVLAAWTGPGPPTPIVTGLDDAMFPAEWRRPPDSARAAPLAAKELPRTVAAVARATAKYPAGVLRTNLDRVYVVGDLRFHGIAAAGTNSRDRVYVRGGP